MNGTNRLKATVVVSVAGVLHGGIAAAADPFSIGFAAAGAIAGFLDSNDRKRWESEVSGKLDQIIAGQHTIFDDLQRLRVDVSHIVQSEFQAALQKYSESDLGLFKVNVPIVAKYPDISDLEKQQIGLNLNELERDLTPLEKGGPATFQTSMASILAVRSIYLFTNVDRQRQILFYRSQAETFKEWLRLTPGYPAERLREESEKLDQDIRDGNRLFNSGLQHIEGARHWGDARGAGCSWKGNIAITGKLESGFQTSASEVVWQRQERG